MPDRIAQVRISGDPATAASLSADLAKLDGWSVIKAAAPYANRHAVTGERLYLIVARTPSADQILAWLHASGWHGGSYDGAHWQKGAPWPYDPAGFAGPTERSADWYIRNVLERKAAAEKMTTGELVPAILAFEGSADHG